MKKKNRLILEFTEFNLQRFNPDSAHIATHVDNPQLSTDAFDRHESGIRQAVARIDDILYNLKGTSAYSDLRSKLALEDQDIQKIKIQRILKHNNVNYNVYLTITIGGEEYWSQILDILGQKPIFNSEVFKDFDLYQPKEWVIRTKGLVIKTIKIWLKPEPGMYKLLNDEVICYSTDTGKQLRMEKGIEVELVRSHDDKIIIKHEGDYYNLVGDNFVYFNWWWEPLED